MTGNKKWCLGIDFGTSHTYISGYDKSNRKFSPVELMPPEFMDEKFIPTLIACDVTKKMETIANLSDLIPGDLVGHPLLSKQETNKDGIIKVAMTPDFPHDQTQKVPDYMQMADHIVVEYNSEKGEKTTYRYYIGQRARAKTSLNQFRDLKFAARKVSPDKESLSDKLNPNFGNADEPCKVSADDLLRVFFRVLFERSGIKKSEIERIVIGCPTGNNYSYKEPCDYGGRTIVNYESVLKKAISEAFRDDNGVGLSKSKIEVISEAELAGVAYLSAASSSIEDLVLVIDSGGGTTDFALLFWDQNGKMQSKRIGAQCNIAGNTMNEAVQDAIADYLFKSHRSIQRPSKESCRRAKEELFLDSNNKSCSDDDLREKESSVGDFVLSYYACDAHPSLEKRANENVYSRIIQMLNNALNDCSNEILNQGKRINKILFVGGMAFVSPFRSAVWNAIVTSKEYRNIVSDSVSEISPFENVEFKLLNSKSTVKLNCFNAVSTGAIVRALDAKLVLTPNIIVRRVDGRGFPATPTNILKVVALTNEEERIEFATQDMTNSAYHFADDKKAFSFVLIVSFFKGNRKSWKEATVELNEKECQSILHNFDVVYLQFFMTLDSVIVRLVRCRTADDLHKVPVPSDVQYIGDEIQIKMTDGSDG